MKSLEDRINFGKYRDIRILDLIRTDPEYVWWAHNNVDGFRLDEEAEMLLDWHLFMCWWERRNILKK